MKKTIIWMLMAVLLIGLCACGQSAATWQEQYDLGLRYLSAGNYEEAIIAFAAAIEIDPKHQDAYIGLADAYVGTGDYEKAAEVLAQAVEAVGETEELTAAQAAVQEQKASAEAAPSSTTEESGATEPEKEIGPRTQRIDRDNGGYIIAEFDANGNEGRTTVYNPDGSVHTYIIFEYDANGNLVRETQYNPDGSVMNIMEYDANGNVVRDTDYNADGSVANVIEY